MITLEKKERVSEDTMRYSILITNCIIGDLKLILTGSSCLNRFESCRIDQTFFIDSTFGRIAVNSNVGAIFELSIFSSEEDDQLMYLISMLAMDIFNVKQRWN